MGFGGITFENSVNMRAIDGVVEVDGIIKPFAYCLAVEESSGISPSIALLKFHGTGTGSGTEINSPVTLSSFGEDFNQFSRVRVLVDGLCIFDGFLVKRRDAGGEDSVTWEAWDNRWLLNYFPVRGCLVWDADVDQVKFIARYTCQTNPTSRDFGLRAWNCVGARIGNDVWPVFTATGDFSRTFQQENDAYNGSLQVGVVTPWTVRHFLRYLYLICHLTRGSVVGTNHAEWRSLNNSDRISWDINSLNLIGSDAAVGSLDPLDRAMPDTTFRGMSVLGALVEALKIAGTHDLSMVGNELIFYPIFVSGAQRSGETDATIRMERGGVPTDADTAFDFVLEEDASELAHAALVEGDSVKIESSLNSIDLQIEARWTELEQTTFLNGVRGVGGDDTYATFPTSNEAKFTLDGLADGQDGRPYALVNTTEAVSLLRLSFPNVLDNFVVNAANSTIAFGGQGGEYTDTSKYPLLQAVGRPVLPTQLEFNLTDIFGLVDYNSKGRLPTRVPLRIQVQGDNGWVDVPAEASGLQLDGDGSFWLSISDKADGQDWCIYSGSIANAEDEITIKNIRMNIAMSHDVRVKGYETAELSGAFYQIDNNIINEFGGPLLRYIDSPGAYREEHQVFSSPTGTEVKTGLVPPGSEKQDAAYAARRALTRDQWVKRLSRWSMIGIRPEFFVGQWVTLVRFFGVDGEGNTIPEYKIDAPITKITFDFVKQETLIGGLISELGDSGYNVLLPGLDQADDEEDVLTRDNAPVNIVRPGDESYKRMLQSAMFEDKGKAPVRIIY